MGGRDRRSVRFGRLPAERAGGKFRILSIDGGGVRGIIPAAVLVQVEAAIRRAKKDPDAKLGECFDMVAGTSTGGILACIYLAPLDKASAPAKARHSAEDALRFYLDHGGGIFDRSIWHRFATAGGLADEKYSSAALERALGDHFGDVELRDLIRPCLVTAYDIKRYKPFFFTQHDARISDERNFYVRDVARATSAAPTYFEAAMPESLDGLANASPMIDGGVFAGNPSACALVEAMRLKTKMGAAAGERDRDYPLEDVAVLSLGTGRKPRSIPFGECKDWGLAGWARPLVDILMDGVSQAADYQLAAIFESAGAPGQYLRVDGDFGDGRNDLDIPGLDPSMDCAAPENMLRLEQFGRQLARNYKEEIDAFAGAHWGRSQVGAEGG